MDYLAAIAKMAVEYKHRYMVQLKIKTEAEQGGDLYTAAKAKTKMRAYDEIEASLMKIMRPKRR